MKNITIKLRTKGFQCASCTHPWSNLLQNLKFLWNSSIRQFSLMLFILYETIIFLISFHFSKLICAPYRVVLIYVVNLLKNKYYWQIQDCTVEGGRSGWYEPVSYLRCWCWLSCWRAVYCWGSFGSYIVGESSR